MFFIGVISLTTDKILPVLAKEKEWTKNWVENSYNLLIFHFYINKKSEDNFIASRNSQVFTATTFWANHEKKHVCLFSLTFAWPFQWYSWNVVESGNKHHKPNQP